MPAHRPIQHSAALVALAVAGTLVLWRTRGWTALGVPHFDPSRKPFSDAYVVLWTPEKCAEGYGEWIASVCFLPSLAAEAHAQAYEPWLTFVRWGLGSEHTLLVSAVMIALFYLALALTFRPASRFELVLCLVLLATPAVQLGVERANFDLLMTALICLSAWLLARGRTAEAITGCVALAFATTLKLYTGLASALAWMIVPRPNAAVMLVAVAGTAVSVAVVGLDTIMVLAHGAPEGATRFSTGAHWLFRHRGAVPAAVTILLGVMVAGAGLVWLRRARVPQFSDRPNRAAAFNVAFLVAVPLYFLKDSYDYRLVLWLPCLALPVAWLRDPIDPRWRALASATVLLYLVTAGMEFPCSLLDRWRGNAAPDGAALLLEALIYVKQLAAWLLVGALGLIFGFGAVQQARVFKFRWA